MTRRKAYLRAALRVERLTANIDSFAGLYPADEVHFKTMKRLSYLLGVAWKQEELAEAALPVPLVSIDSLAGEAARGWA